MRMVFFTCGLYLLQCFSASSALAFAIILTNRAGTLLPLALLTDSAGTPLPAGSLGQACALPLPPGTTPANLTTHCGLPLLWSYALPFGPNVRVGLTPGIVEQEIRQPLPKLPASALTDKSIFFFFFNASTMSAATEALVLEFPAVLFQTDFAPGFDRQIRLHLINATVHLGSRQPDGSLRTAPFPSPCYQTWAAMALTVFPLFTGPNQDPDHDGIVNLLEYLHGTNPAVSDAALSAPSLVLHPDRTLTFSWRQAPVALHATLTPYASTSLTLPSQSVTNPLPTSTVLASLPPGILWRSLHLPASSERLFLTLKGALLPSASGAP